MKRLAIVLGVALIGLLSAAPASAQRTRQVTVPIDEHFQDPFWTEQCGFPVFIDVVGDARVTLIYNADGLVVREVDHPTAYFSFRAPSTGKTVTGHFQPVNFDYGSGAVVGSRTVVSVMGLFGHLPGVVRPDAGLLRYEGVVTGFDEFGIPLVDFVAPIKEAGRREEMEAVVAGICGTLSDP